MSYLRRVLPYVRPYWMLAFASAILTLLTSAAGLLAPWPLNLHLIANLAVECDDGDRARSLC